GSLKPYRLDLGPNLAQIELLPHHFQEDESTWTLDRGSGRGKRL
ncbi:MAG: hypothetical protein ACI84E_000889, partial [Planctomycetota bacterium]